MMEEFKAFADTLKSREAAKTEEATKTSYIMPFFELLGYNTKNPIEFVPEYDAEVGTRKGDKVDYCIIREDEPIIIVEAKHHKENLDNHFKQLYHYYATIHPKFAVLTNGVEYRFFTDTDKKNVMDTKPFFIFNALKFSEQDVATLKKFRKNSFDVFSLGNIAEEMKYANQIKYAIKGIIEEPNDDFIRYILSDIHKGKKTQQLVDKLRPIVKEAIGKVVDELITARLADIQERMKAEEPVEPETPAEKEIISQVNTTKEELEAFFNVKYILRNIVPWDKLHYRDAKHYFSILYDDKNYKWICRLRVEKANKYIILPDGTPHGKSCPLNGISGVFDYADEIIESAKRFTQED